MMRFVGNGSLATYDLHLTTQWYAGVSPGLSRGDATHFSCSLAGWRELRGNFDTGLIFAKRL